MEQSRKNFLKNFLIGATSVPLILEACKKDVASSGSSSGSGSGSSSGSCIVTPAEEEGPYPYPGGEITNPLARVDVTGGQTGIPLALTLKIVNTNNSCAVVSGARVDIWHCNKDGYYSGYSGQPGTLGTQSYVGQTWLRGYQTTDANGLVQFTTIYPGWYAGRATHIHLEIFISNTLKKQAQMAFSEVISDAVHVTSLYSAHGINTTRNAADSVFGNSATDLANETLVIAGSTSAGYTGAYTIGLAL